MKNCDCVEDFQKAIREQSGDPTAEIEQAFEFNGTGVESYPAFHAKYRKKKNDGSFYKKVERTVLKPNFCPFCGVKNSLKITKIMDENENNGYYMSSNFIEDYVEFIEPYLHEGKAYLRYHLRMSVETVEERNEFIDLLSENGSSTMIPTDDNTVIFRYD